ncbi:UBC-like protein [Pisolithus orientalis]|uniref:UBC-like protein n=1 Tax=Pisolithus orientalis TaxID=936130 RepID=UPI002224E199|nr:UBC-like protein [Pisolithus orientalis]KAI6028330.1 UBC-like protein [Pisolithus orientalis]
MPPLNRNNTAVKRIMQEARELANDLCADYHAAPLEEWHCTLRGPIGTEFEGGLYHFRILLPAEYPFRPPSLMMLTPNGRFELNTKICISFTNYHEEEWQPAWGAFFPLRGQAANGVGSVEYPISERKRLAQLSREWVCPKCRLSNLECLPDLPSKVDGSPESVGETPENEPITRAHTHSPGTSPPTAIRQDPERVPETALNPARRSTLRPPLLLDTVICVLLVLVVGLLCRRVL